jgi:hypothetical protein
MFDYFRVIFQKIGPVAVIFGGCVVLALVAAIAGLAGVL